MPMCAIASKSLCAASTDEAADGNNVHSPCRRVAVSGIAAAPTTAYVRQWSRCSAADDGTAPRRSVQTSPMCIAAKSNPNSKTHSIAVPSRSRPAQPRRPTSARTPGLAATSIATLESAAPATGRLMATHDRPPAVPIDEEHEYGSSAPVSAAGPRSLTTAPATKRCRQTFLSPRTCSRALSLESPYASELAAEMDAAANAQTGALGHVPG
jgi:hypothetical protein